MPFRMASSEGPSRSAIRERKDVCGLWQGFARLPAAVSCLTSGAVTFNPSDQIDREVTSTGVDGLAVNPGAEKMSMGHPPQQLVLQLSAPAIGTSRQAVRGTDGAEAPLY